MAGFPLEQLPALMSRLSQAVRNGKEELTHLDAAAGDGDLGVNMVTGFESMAAAAAESFENFAQAFGRCAAAFNRAAPSTLGTILSAALTGFGTKAGTAKALDLFLFAEMLEEGQRQMMELGGAKPGDKTILDAWAPYAAAIREGAEAGQDGCAVLESAAKAATHAAAQTAELSPKIGRARMYGEKAAAVPDGGAMLFALLAQELAQEYKEICWNSLQ